MSALGRARRSLVTKVLGLDVVGAHAHGSASLDAILGEVRNLRAELDELRGREFAKAALLRAERDHTDAARIELEKARRSEDYRRAFEEATPLVSVRIAAYRKTDELMDVAIASVLRQTYDNFEIRVVNDGPNERTRAAIDALGHPKVHYEELPKRGEYPEHARLRWMVAGTGPMNRAVDLAQGLWVAPLDDDDEFTDDHLEKLVALAKHSRAELVYGATLQVNEINGNQVRIWSDPPRLSNFGFAAAMYLRVLHPTFQYDDTAWLVNEPGDWHLARRMLAAGVTHAAIEDVLAISHQVPYTHKTNGD